LRAQLDQLKGSFVDFLFPAHCFGCGREGSFLCGSCIRTLPRLLPPLCRKCGRPLLLEDRCSICSKWTLGIDGIRSPFILQGVIRQAVHQFKYGNLRALASPLALLLAGDLEARPLPVDVIIPVPLHRRRLRERGYNQSALLARELSGLTGLPLLEGSLLRLRDTPAQVRTAGAADRRKNVRGAFGWKGTGAVGGRFLVVDDVCTTGATLDSCAVALKAAGAESVWGLSLAREV
jgi:ComF family protein